MKATQIVHWPGNSIASCEDHAQKLKSIGAVMGFSVSSTPSAPEVECTNCKNEEKKGNN